MLSKIGVFATTLLAAGLIFGSPFWWAHLFGFVTVLINMSTCYFMGKTAGINEISDIYKGA